MANNSTAYFPLCLFSAKDDKEALRKVRLLMEVYEVEPTIRQYKPLVKDRVHNGPYDNVISVFGWHGAKKHSYGLVKKVNKLAID